MIPTFRTFWRGTLLEVHCPRKFYSRGQGPHPSLEIQGTEQYISIHSFYVAADYSAGQIKRKKIQLSTYSGKFSNAVF
jgi:hypothetical protein